MFRKAAWRGRGWNTSNDKKQHANAYRMTTLPGERRASRVAGPAEDRLSFRLQVAGKLELVEDGGLLPDGLLDDAQ